jgi:hypothetical protein
VNPGTCAPASASGSSLFNFVGGAFNAATEDGFLALGAQSSPNNLGVSRPGTGSMLHNYSADLTNFLLQVTFTAPSVTNNNAVYTAAVSGAVKNESGGVFVTFDANPPTLALNGPDRSGTLSVQLNSVPINSGGQVAIGGFVEISVTPEPGTTALFATGLAGSIPMVRLPAGGRRRPSRSRTLGARPVKCLTRSEAQRMKEGPPLLVALPSCRSELARLVGDAEALVEMQSANRGPNVRRHVRHLELRTLLAAGRRALDQRAERVQVQLIPRFAIHHHVAIAML